MGAALPERHGCRRGFLRRRETLLSRSGDSLRSRLPVLHVSCLFGENGGGGRRPSAFGVSGRIESVAGLPLIAASKEAQFASCRRSARPPKRLPLVPKPSRSVILCLPKSLRRNKNAFFPHSGFAWDINSSLRGQANISSRK